MSALHSTYRRIFKNPVSSILATLTLALGIGAVTAVFSLIDQLLWHPLPFSEPNRLIEVYHRRADRPSPSPTTSIPRYRHYQTNQTVFSDLAATLADAMAMTGSGEPVQLFGQRVTSNAFTVLGVKPLLGRLFSADEDKPANTSVIISDRCWKNRLGGDPAVIGKIVTLNGIGYTVVGVVPSFPKTWGGDTEIWTTWPFTISGRSEEELSRGLQMLNLIGRLKPGVTLQQAQSNLDVLSSTYTAAYPTNVDAKRIVTLVTAQDEVTRDVRRSLVVVGCAALCLLVIGCSNVANLLLARFAGRQREVAVRSALGAPTGAIIKLFLSESIGFSLLSCLLGLLFSGILLTLLPAVSGNSFYLESHFPLSGSAVLFAFTLALALGFGLGLFPAWQAGRLKLTDTLKEGGRSSTPSRASRRFRSLLLMAQVALALSLISSAGVLVKTFVNLQKQNIGFQPARVYTAAVDLPSSRYPDISARSRFAERLLAEFHEGSAVESASVVLGPPFSGNRSTELITPADGSPAPFTERPGAFNRSCAPHYFETMGIPLLQGRDFTANDTTTSQRVVILSKTVADKLYPGQNPIGRSLLVGTMDGRGIATEIVGVVDNVRSMALSRSPEEEIYRPWSQYNIGYTQIMLRGRFRAESVASDLRAAIQRVDPLLPLMREGTLSLLIEQSLGQNRLLTGVVSTFGSLAIILAMLGIYSIASYNVTQRTEEIGLRMALGAQARDVVVLMLRQALKPAIVGISLGVILTFWGKRLLANQLFGVSPLDPWVLVGSVLLIVIAAAIASSGPALRAARIDPLKALRNE